MDKSITLHVGLDVRKDSIGGDLTSLDKTLRKLTRKEPPVACGVCGRALRVRDLAPPE